MRDGAGVAMLHEDLNYLAKPVRAGSLVLIVAKPPFTRIQLGTQARHEKTR